MDLVVRNIDGTTRPLSRNYGPITPPSPIYARIDNLEKELVQLEGDAQFNTFQGAEGEAREKLIEAARIRAELNVLRTELEESLPAASSSLTEFLAKPILGLPTWGWIVGIGAILLLKK